MRLSVEIKEMHFLFLVGVLAVVSAVGIVTGYGGTEPSVVGHTPGEITGGTFGAGDYVFPNNLDVGGNLDVQNNISVSGSIGIGGTDPDAALYVTGNVKMFGEKEAKYIDTVYQAETDGFVVVNPYLTGQHCYFSVYSDSSNPPTTLYVSSETYHPYGSMSPVTVPIRKGDYWQVVNNYGNNPEAIWWVPIGV